MTLIDEPDQVTDKSLLPAAEEVSTGAPAEPAAESAGPEGGAHLSLIVFPEPVTALMVGIGVLGLWALGRVPQ